MHLSGVGIGTPEAGESFKIFVDKSMKIFANFIGNFAF